MSEMRCAICDEPITVREAVEGDTCKNCLFGCDWDEVEALATRFTLYERESR